MYYTQFMFKIRIVRLISHFSVTPGALVKQTSMNVHPTLVIMGERVKTW